MKSIYTLAIVAALGLVSTRAEGIVGSPKYQEMNRRPLTSTGSDVRQTFEYRGGKSVYASHSVVTNGMKERDLVREQRDVVYTGKNPLRDLQKQFEVAPVK
jgi:hypothetical protein